MDDTPEVIRQQMNETKSQLSDKLESLEHQVSDTVQSTGAAVNSTVEAVHDTVDAVTGAVQDAVQSVSHAFDMRRQVDRHPWLILGGAVVAGYLAAEYLTGPARKSGQLPPMVPSPSRSAAYANHRNGQPAIESAVSAASNTVPRDSGLQSSSWHRLKSAAFVTLIRIGQDLAVRAVPLAMNYLSGDRARVEFQPYDDHGGRRNFLSPQQSLQR